MELENSLTAIADDMHMGRPMVIWVNHRAQTLYHVNSWHSTINLSVLVDFSSSSFNSKTVRGSSERLPTKSEVIV
jgi:hypothetical protein